MYIQNIFLKHLLIARHCLSFDTSWTAISNDRSMQGCKGPTISVQLGTDPKEHSTPFRFTE